MSMPALLQDQLRLPVIASPMFIASNPKLVIAQCRAGIVGSFPALNARPKEMLEEWLKNDVLSLETVDSHTKTKGLKVLRIDGRLPGEKGYPLR